MEEVEVEEEVWIGLSEVEVFSESLEEEETEEEVATVALHPERLTERSSNVCYNLFFIMIFPIFCRND